MTTNHVEKKIMLRAARSRVWRALSDPKEFGHWFGVRLDGPFREGAKVTGTMVPTAVDTEVAKLQKPYEGRPFEITMEKIEPERLFSFRWHPFAVEPGVDYSAEPTTLVELTIEDAPGGVLLTVRESGFDHIPLARRAKAFEANEGGWTKVVALIEKHLAQTA